MKILEILDPRSLTEPRLIEFYEPSLRRIVPRLVDGSIPPFLYRIMSANEYEIGVHRGMFAPRERTHASIVPLWEYCEPGDQNVLVQIRYDDADGWQAKSTMDKIVAITSQPIAADNVRLVGKGTRVDLQASI